MCNTLSWAFYTFKGRASQNLLFSNHAEFVVVADLMSSRVRVFFDVCVYVCTCVCVCVCVLDFLTRRSDTTRLSESIRRVASRNLCQVSCTWNAYLRWSIYVTYYIFKSPQHMHGCSTRRVDCQGICLMRHVYDLHIYTRVYTWHTTCVYLYNMRRDASTRLGGYDY